MVEISATTRGRGSLLKCGFQGRMGAPLDVSGASPFCPVRCPCGVASNPLQVVPMTDQGASDVRRCRISSRQKTRLERSRFNWSTGAHDSSTVCATLYARATTAVARKKRTSRGSAGNILFHRKRHPAEMGVAEMTQFLTALAVQRKVAAATQNQALSALLFLYRDVLGQEVPWLDGIVHANRLEEADLRLWSNSFEPPTPDELEELSG